MTLIFRRIASLGPASGRVAPLLLAAGLLAAGLLAGCRDEAPEESERPAGTVVLGSKNFTEQIILGELVAQMIEATTDLTVDRRLNLGGTFVCHEAITNGEIDSYVEYTGTAFSAILREPAASDADRVYDRVKQLYEERFDLTWTEPLGFDNPFAIVVQGEDARRLNLRTISDLADHPEMRPGFGYEFNEREDGFNGLVETYGLNFEKPAEIMDMGLLYRALEDDEVDFVAGNATDGLISRLDLVVLEDDKDYFPPYEVAPVVRREALQQYPALQQVFQRLGGIITAEEMRQMNYAVDGEERDPASVVQEFLASKGIQPDSTAAAPPPEDVAAR